MAFASLDATKLIVFMIVGLLFSMVGLYLLLRPKASDETARIEAFGLKFQASSAGMVVFIVGAVFLAVPLFVTENERGTSAGTPAAGVTARQSDAQQIVSNGPRNTVLSDGAEVEPNNSLAAANFVTPTITIAGSIERGDVDYFCVDTSDVINRSLIANITTANAAGTSLAIVDDIDTSLTKTVVYINGSGSVSSDITTGLLCVTVQQTNGTGTYRLTIAIR